MNWNYDLHRVTARERQERARRRNQEREWLDTNDDEAEITEQNNKRNRRQR